MYKERRKSKDHGTYFRTTALLEDGTIATGYGEEYDVGDEVEVLYDEKWDMTKMQKSDWDKEG